MQHVTRGRLIKLLTWGVMVPLAALLIVVNLVLWRTQVAWAASVSNQTLPLVVMGFGLILIVQALKDKQKSATK